ncbi:uncharacterized protein PpBr36_09859 [Pyricularia pennisetigena]|uniref:uncharacterized protein n=1 Tax=Pyricularia pennisetigena TaxID=1578925 RepID=UPI00114F1A7F|nr:uncharacterized protein PpBr36_09859 [Pyricularia pennisetigena]TLS22265.1 hypothetical protein PpBr36_09859 [Pyricularia pennisetigena]
MPLFSRHEPPKEEVVVQEPVRQERRGLFGRKRSVSPVPTARRTSAPAPAPMAAHNTSPTGRDGGGFFNRHRRSVDANSVSSMSTASTSASPPRRRSTLLSRRHHDTTDPSILAARERIMGAEEAERQADRALDIARREVRDARDHIVALEREAKEQARLAKIKEQGAREVSKRGKALGRHGI